LADAPDSDTKAEEMSPSFLDSWAAWADRQWTDFDAWLSDLAAVAGNIVFTDMVVWAFDFQFL
jgi:hypothetical protein